MDMPIGDDGGPWVKVMFFVPFDFFNRNPVGTDAGIVHVFYEKNRNKIITMKSLILAQDER